MKLISKASKILRLILRPSKLRLTNLGHVDVVIFDRIYESYFEQLISGRTSLTFDPRYEDHIDLPAFLSGLASWLFSGRRRSVTHHYFSEFLRRTRPKLILSSSYFSEELYSGRIASASGDTRLFVFQRGVDSLKALNQAQMKKGDFFFSLTEAYSLAWQEVVKPGQILTFGSLPSLLFSRPSTKEVGKKVGFISQVQPDGQFEGLLGLSNSEFYQPERLFLKKIADAVEKFGGSFEVLGRSERCQELDFFRDSLGGRHLTFHRRVSPEDTYLRLRDFDLIISVDSTLGIEALARGLRVMFLDVGMFTHRLPFWYPSQNIPQLAKRHLMLELETSGMWSDQMVQVMKMSERDYQSCVVDVIGKPSQTNELRMIQQLVNSALNK